ncbi:hypothetical protein [Calothrix sp. 336/3]|uniref:hypothetical protein n=1 Tax=Calothrix sp. 336/3 TaxID=1337936 RepID=UPI0004E2C4BA|nr:hypothetical protein [Calothrix sp. 336/3]AKG21038.1 hypothetical protein IJ00_06765 [Calothrix sp. 336/3]
MKVLPLIQNSGFALLAISATLIAASPSPAGAAMMTYNFTGTVTELYGNGTPLQELRGTRLGDSIFGTFSFDDQVPEIFPNEIPLTSFQSNISPSLLAFSAGTFNTLTGNITLPRPNLTGAPIFLAFSTNQGKFGFSARNTAIIGTYNAVKIPETTSILGLGILAGFGIVGIQRKRLK